MPTNQDFRDLFSCFAAADVRFLVVGAHAVIHFTQPRYTKDLDVWIDATEENARRTYLALTQFGAPLANVTPEDLAHKEMVLQIGVEPNRIDVIMGLEGLSFDACHARSVETTYGGVPIRVLALDDLIDAKRRADRPQDRLDIEWLLRARDQR